MGKRYNNILETVGHTPAVKINKLAPEGVNLYVKVEAFNPLGSVKDRLALGIIEDAERTGKLKPGQTVIEATSGNTGIGLAMVCAQKGYPLVLIMAETFSHRTPQADALPRRQGRPHPCRQPRHRHGCKGRQSSLRSTAGSSPASSPTRPTPTSLARPPPSRSSTTSATSRSTTGSPASAPAER